MSLLAFYRWAGGRLKIAVDLMTRYFFLNQTSRNKQESKPARTANMTAELNFSFCRLLIAHVHLANALVFAVLYQGAEQQP